jgi:hypothetical protein
MAESDGTVEVLREIRDEIRNVRTELLQQIRSARTGVRTERFDRASRWRLAAMAGTGAVAFVALVLSLRAGRQPATVLMAAPVVAAAPAAAPVPALAVTPAPVALPTAVAAKPAATKGVPQSVSGSAVAASVPASATAAAKKRVKPSTAKPALETAAGDDDATMAFSPPPRRVRVHKMSYGPVESEPAKL